MVRHYGVCPVPVARRLGGASPLCAAAGDAAGNAAERSARDAVSARHRAPGGEGAMTPHSDVAARTARQANPMVPVRTACMNRDHRIVRGVIVLWGSFLQQMTTLPPTAGLAGVVRGRSTRRTGPVRVRPVRRWAVESGHPFRRCGNRYRVSYSTDAIVKPH